MNELIIKRMAIAYQLGDLAWRGQVPSKELLEKREQIRSEIRKLSPNSIFA